MVRRGVAARCSIKCGPRAIALAASETWELREFGELLDCRAGAGQTIQPRDRPGWIGATYPRDRGSRLDKARLEHAQVPAAAARSQHIAEHLWVFETKTELETGLARLGNLRRDAANPQHVADAH